MFVSASEIPGTLNAKVTRVTTLLWPVSYVMVRFVHAGIVGPGRFVSECDCWKMKSGRAP